MGSLSTRLNTIRHRIDAACERVGRERNEVRLIAVSKTHPVETIRESIDAGCTIFGENKV